MVYVSPGPSAHPGPRAFWLGGGCEGGQLSEMRGILPTKNWCRGQWPQEQSGLASQSKVVWPAAELRIILNIDGCGVVVARRAVRAKQPHNNIWPRGNTWD